MTIATFNHAAMQAEIRAALRLHGWTLHRSPRSNREAADYAAYYVYDAQWNHVVFGGPFGASLDLVQDWLATLPPQ